MPAQIAGAAGIEPVAARGGSALAVEDAGNDGIGIMDGEAAYKSDGLFVCADRCRF